MAAGEVVCAFLFGHESQKVKDCEKETPSVGNKRHFFVILHTSKTVKTQAPVCLVQTVLLHVTVHI